MPSRLHTPPTADPTAQPGRFRKPSRLQGHNRATALRPLARLDRDQLSLGPILEQHAVASIVHSIEAHLDRSFASCASRRQYTQQCAAYNACIHSGGPRAKGASHLPTSEEESSHIDQGAPLRASLAWPETSYDSILEVQKCRVGPLFWCTATANEQIDQPCDSLTGYVAYATRSIQHLPSRSHISKCAFQHLSHASRLQATHCHHRSTSHAAAARMQLQRARLDLVLKRERLSFEGEPIVVRHVEAYISLLTGRHATL